MNQRKKSLSTFVKPAFLHICLLVGSVLFAIPFVWLASTSAKTPDEMYPPRWLPQLPLGVTESPYMSLRENERPIRPEAITSDEWDLLREAVAERLLGIREQLPAHAEPWLKDNDLADGILARIIRRAPDDVLNQDIALLSQWFTERVDAPLAAEVFNIVYRRVAMGPVVFFGWDALNTEFPNQDTGGLHWSVVSGDAELVERDRNLRTEAQEVHYSGFDESGTITLSTVLPLKMELSRLKKTVVSMRCDRSWHKVLATIEINGRKYGSAQTAFTGSDRQQEFSWQFPSEDDNSLKTKTWLRLKDLGASDFEEPGQARITVDIQYSPRYMAAFNKYINNYRDALRMVPLGAYVKNSVLLVVLNILGQVMGSSLVAYAFARLQWPGREFYFALVLATLMIPPQVTMIPGFLIFRWLGWYNTLLPLWVGSFCGSAFFIFLLRQFMKSIPRDLEDSARIDGCSFFGIYWRIVMPLVKPAVATIGIFTFMGVWNDFMGPLIFLNDQRLYPLSLGLFALQVFQSGNYGIMMAASVLMTIPIIVLFFAAQRQFIQGITLTGMKG